MDETGIEVAEDVEVPVQERQELQNMSGRDMAEEMLYILRKLEPIADMFGAIPPEMMQMMQQLGG
jgi:hypothetical protein